MLQISASLFRTVSLREGFLFRLVMLAPSSYCWGRWLDHFSSAVEENSIYNIIFLLLLFFVLEQEACRLCYKPRRDVVAVLPGSKISITIDISMDVRWHRRLVTFCSEKSEYCRCPPTQRLHDSIQHDSWKGKNWFNASLFK